MAMFRCGSGAKVLYAGDVALKGYTASSASKYISGQVFVGTGLSNVQCAATIKETCNIYNSNNNLNVTCSCTYDSSTGYITIKCNISAGGFYGYGSGTAYLIAVKEK